MDKGFDSIEFDFVPKQDLERLKKFWGEPRSFYEWLYSHPKHIAHGQTVSVSDTECVSTDLDHKTSGSFLYMWNNIGRVITPNGESMFCYFKKNNI